MMTVERITPTLARVGVPLTSRERAQHEAEQAALRAADKHEVANKARANGMKRRQIRAADGSVQEVWSFSSSFAAMGFQDHQIAAAERFEGEWQTAYRGLQGQGLAPGVDGGSNPHGPHMARVTAQNGLARCKAYLGQRSYDIVVAVTIHGATVTGISKAAGRDHRTVRTNVALAFDELDGFYNGARRKDQTWQAFETLIARRAEQIAQAEKDAG